MKKQVHCIILAFVFLSFLFDDLYCLGSDTTPSRQAAATFLTGGNATNIMLGFGCFINGFTLTDVNTTCSFDSFEPIAGTVNMNNGRLYLNQDLFFQNPLTFNNIGRIIGNDYSIVFPKSLSTSLVPSTQRTGYMQFDSATVVFGADTTLQAPFHFTGSCVIAGRGNRLTISNSAPLVVRPGGSLVIQDAELVGVGDANIRCVNDNGAVTFKNCNLNLARNYSFSNGAITFQDDVLISGTNKWSYTASRTSTIASGSMVFFDRNTTFSYAPRIAKKDLLSLTDVSSYLFFNGCTLFSTHTGLQLSTGTIFFDNKVTLTTEARNTGEAIVFKSGVQVSILSGSFLDMFGVIIAE